jgi:hypothetical protein
MLLCQHAMQHAVLRKACPLLVRNEAARAAVTNGLMKQLQLLNQDTTAAAAAQGVEGNGTTASAEVEGVRVSVQQSPANGACAWADLAVQQAFGLNSVVAATAGADSTRSFPTCTETACTCSLHIGQQQQQQRVVTGEVAHLAHAKGSSSSSSSSRHSTVQLQELLLQQVGGQQAELMLLEQQLQDQQLQRQQQGSAGTAAAGHYLLYKAGAAQPSSMLRSCTEHGSTSSIGLGVLEWIEAAQEPAAAAAAAAEDAASAATGKGGDGCALRGSHVGASCTRLAVQVLIAASACEAAGAITDHHDEAERSSSDGCMLVVEAAAAQLPGALQQLLHLLFCEACRCRSAAAYVEAAAACLAARRAVRHAHLALHMHYTHQG